MSPRMALRMVYVWFAYVFHPVDHTFYVWFPFAIFTAHRAEEDSSRLRSSPRISLSTDSLVMPSGRGHPDSFAILTCSWMTSATYADRMSPRFTAHRVTASYPASVSQKSHSRHRLFPPPLVPDGSGRRIILSASSRLPAYRSSTFCGISIHRRSGIRAPRSPSSDARTVRCRASR